MKKDKLIIISLFFSSAVYAEIAGNIAITSDYRLYGFSQTLEDPALQLVLEYDFDNGFVVGAFLSNVDYVEDSDPDDLEATYEFTSYVTYGLEIFKGHDLAFTLIKYSYPGSIST